jgi:hypothetical protein
MIPKSKSQAPANEEDAHVWDELPPPPSFDAEDEWSKEGDKVNRQKGAPRKSVSSVILADRDSDEKAARVGFRKAEPAVRQVEFEPIAVVPPDARLLIDDLRMEYPDDHAVAADKSRASASRWVFYTAAIVIPVIFGALALLILLDKSNPKVNPLGVPPLFIEQEEKYPRGEHIADLLARKHEAIELFGRFIRSESSEDLTGIVRLVPDKEVLVGRSLGPEGLPADWRIPADAKWDVHTDQDPVFGVLSGYYPDDRKFQAFFILENGRLWMDWKATMCYGSVSFPELVKGAGTASEVRVWVEPATFYPSAFPESDYRSFKIYTSLDDPAVWAFARRASDAEQKLASIFHKSMFGGDKINSSMVLLSLARGSAEAAPNQWLINDLLHTAWVLP